MDYDYESLEEEEEEYEYQSDSDYEYQSDSDYEYEYEHLEEYKNNSFSELMLKYPGIAIADNKITIYLETFLNLDIKSLKLLKLLFSIIIIKYNKNGIYSLLYEKTHWQIGILKTIYNQLIKIKPLNNGLDTEYIKKIIEYLYDICNNLTKRCMNCWVELELKYIDRLKPTLCNSELCKYSAELYGIGVDLIYEIIENKEVIKLLIELYNLTTNNLKNKNQSRHLLKKTSDINNIEDRNFYLHLSNNFNWYEMSDIVIPDIEQLYTLAVKGNLIHYLNSVHPLLQQFMNWLIVGNPSIIVNINEEIKEFRGWNQFLLHTGDYNHERTFQSLKKQYGSFFVFHGSGIENWHPILRGGLKILSNTKRMVHGAANGAGIYTTTDFSVSLGHTYTEKKIIAICEVIDCKSKYINRNGSHYIIQDEAFITTRFLLEKRFGSIGVKTKVSVSSGLLGLTGMPPIPAGINNKGVNTCMNIDSNKLNLEKYIDLEKVKEIYNQQTFEYESEYNPITRTYKVSIENISSDDKCPICLCEFSEKDEDGNENGPYKLANCIGHYYHKECLERTIEIKPKCVICGKIYGKIIGEQPYGTMTSTLGPKGLPGYESDQIIYITYRIPNGIKDGKKYTGTTRVCYLPNNTEGKLVFKLLQQAFEQKLIFTIGDSLTTGAKNVVTWASIHHKTNMRGGAHGYPDPTYLSRVREELAQYGIV